MHGCRRHCPSVFCETWATHCSDSRYECRDENNVTSLLEGAWSIFSPCPAFLCLSSSTPCYHLLLNILSAFSNIFHHLTLTPKLSQPFINFAPTLLHSWRDFSWLDTTSGTHRRGQQLWGYNSCTEFVTAWLFPQNIVNWSPSPLLWTDKRKTQIFLRTCLFVFLSRVRWDSKLCMN